MKILYHSARLIGLVASLALFAPSVAEAQDIPLLSTEQTEEAKTDLLQTAVEVVTSGASGSPTYGTLASSVGITTDQDETTATLSLSYNRSHPVGAGTLRKDGSFKFSFATESYSVTASAPLGKNGNPSTFDFDTFGDDTSLKFGFVRYQGSVIYRKSDDPRGNIAQTNARVDFCISGGSSIWVSAQADKKTARETSAMLRARIDSLMAANPSWSPAWTLSQIASSNDPKDKDIAPLAKLLAQKCDNVAGEDNPGTIAYRSMGGEADQYVNDEGLGGIWYLGVNGTVARSNYEYLVQGPLSKTDVSKTKYKVQGFGGWIFPSGMASVTGSFAYSRAFKAGDDVQLCEPNGLGAQLACLTGPLGAPAQTDRYVLAGEGRILIPLGRGESAAKIGIAPSVSYEIKSDAFLFQLPIFLAQDKEGKKLTGGLRMAFDTGTDDFVVGLFIGVPFSIFFN